MAKNGSTGHGRIGIIKNRAQAYNSKTHQFVKLDTATHRFISNSPSKYKDIRSK